VSLPNRGPLGLTRSLNTLDLILSALHSRVRPFKVSPSDIYSIPRSVTLQHIYSRRWVLTSSRDFFRVSYHGSQSMSKLMHSNSQLSVLSSQSDQQNNLVSNWDIHPAGDSVAPSSSLIRPSSTTWIKRIQWFNLSVLVSLPLLAFHGAKTTKLQSYTLLFSMYLYFFNMIGTLHLIYYFLRP